MVCSPRQRLDLGQHQELGTQHKLPTEMVATQWCGPPLLLSHHTLAAARPPEHDLEVRPRYSNTGMDILTTRPNVCSFFSLSLSPSFLSSLHSPCSLFSFSLMFLFQFFFNYLCQRQGLAGIEKIFFQEIIKCLQLT